jgi:hypothetical protein
MICGFNPDPGGLRISQVMDALKKGEAFPGIVRVDTPIFTAARRRGLTIQSVDLLFSDKSFQSFQRRLDEERKQSQFTYGFPDANGDCNCTTWLERLGLPMLTGRINELTSLPGVVVYPSRRFGECN